MAHDLEIDRRLREARPRAAVPDPEAFDARLLDNVRRQPIAARGGVSRTIALPAAAVAALAVAALVMLGGSPAGVGGPSAASAITRALHWLNPPSGTVLHARSTETQGGRTTIREVWQSADDPAAERLIVSTGARRYETSGGDLYDPATNTIYGVTEKPSPPHEFELISGDPIVQKVRTLLARGDMEVSGPMTHNGTSAFAIALKPTAGRPTWTLWVSAADGKPLELRDPGRDASEPQQVITWSSYEVLSGSSATTQSSLRTAHPTARIVGDSAQVDAALARLTGLKTEDTAKSGTAGKG
jgi:hypothetical protein